MMMRDGMKKSTLGRIFAAIALLGAGAFALAEVATRLLAPMDALVYQDSADPRLGFELRPGARGMKAGVPVEINAQGLRDEPISAEKPPEERRVVVVGGHETFGLGVSSEDTFVRRLAADLVPAGAGRARTINLSMYSYSLSQKLELACTKVAALKPDVVVLQTAENDLKDLPPPAVTAPRLKNWAREHSAAARWAAEKRYLSQTTPAPEQAPVKPDPETAAANFEKTREELQRFKDCVTAAGAAAAVLFVPSTTDTGTSAPSDLHGRLESGAKSLGMPFMDAGPALRRVPAAERLLHPDVPFLSPAAHKSVADELRKRLKPLLEKRRRPAPTPRPSV